MHSSCSCWSPSDDFPSPSPSVAAISIDNDADRDRVGAHDDAIDQGIQRRGKTRRSCALWRVAAAPLPADEGQHAVEACRPCSA